MSRTSSPWWTSTSDVTPGTRRPPRSLGRPAHRWRSPCSLVRAEDFPAAVNLAITAQAPLTAALGSTTLVGQDQVATTMRITVPENTPSGTYVVTVTADDGTRQRTSTFPVVVDSDPPIAIPPASALRPGSSLGAGLNSVGTWTAASDTAGTVARYEVRWRVDGTLGSPTTLSAATRQASRKDQALVMPTPCACA